MKVLFFGVILFISCGEKTTPFESLENELKKNPQNIQYENKNVNNLTLQLPVNTNKWAQKYLQWLIRKDLETEYCKDEESQINIYYDITFSTKNLLSIKKETNIMFCYPYDHIYKDFINILLFQNNIYTIDIRNSKHIQQVVNRYLETEDIDLDCEYSQGEHELSLTFEKNTAYIYLVKDKVCFLKIPIEISKENLIIQPLKRVIKDN